MTNASTAYLSPHRNAPNYRNRSPSVSSISSVNSTSSNTSAGSSTSRLYPRPTPNMSAMTSSRSTRTITTLTPSTSTYFPRRKSSTSSTTSNASVKSAIVSNTQQRPSHGENVQVCVRCRPVSQNEFLKMQEGCWDVDSNVSRIKLSEIGLQKRREASKGRQIEHYYGILKYSRQVYCSSLFYFLLTPK
ncbi:hypothetical protein BDA99DRAFT_142048 [Phascolomyces articulosus]|uniref:Uncharacterized protein n=1 Tax=Phascolomyces articulosus TaxID=60185 RepID=A0AAD5JW26_9FUNG|nr:hypothetical protein BDA99DRAFT_142048 [Phascolomyces articulosus]